MFRLLFVSLLSFASASRWEDFMGFLKRHNKEYESMEKMEERFAIYRDNMEYISSVNSQQSNYTLGETFFADMTLDEFRQYHTQKVPLGQDHVVRSHHPVTQPQMNLTGEHPIK